MTTRIIIDRNCKGPANKGKKVRGSDSPLDNRDLEDQERSITGSVRPQYSVGPQYVEGYVEKRQTAY